MIPLVALLWACGHPEAPQTPGPDLTDRVRFEAARPAEVVPVGTFAARVSPEPGATASIGPGVAGRLVSWHVRPGALVEAGAPLAELVSADLSGLRSRVAELEADLRAKEQVVADREQALAHGVATAAELRAAEAERALSTASLQAARGQLVARSDTSTSSGSRWTWRAPMSGVVDRIDCGVGTLSADAACVVLVRPSDVALEVWVPERALGAADSAVEAEFVGADGSAARFVETARSPWVDPERHARRFWFTAADTTPILPGSTGRARLTVKARPGDRLVPVAALVTWDDGDAVFVPDGSTGRAVPVERLGRVGDDAVVRGLPDDAAVAVTGAFLLKSLATLEEGA